MIRESVYVMAAKTALREEMEKLPLTAEQKQNLSKGIAKFTAAAVREDRVHRRTHDALAKLCDVVFNGRPA
jgi:hypothetical protein